MFDVDIVEKKSIQIMGEQYAPMIQKIQDYRPVIQKDTSNFNKTQSQFMDNILTVSHFTPLRNIRQILAEVKKAQQALNESYFNVEKKKVEIKKLKRKLEIETDDLEKEILQVRILEKESQIFAIQENQTGAIRKISNYIDQIQSIKKNYGIDDFSEVDFEAEEEKYHIAKAFEQGINAARSSPLNLIDEGNHIYFSQIGINGAIAQQYVSQLLNAEKEIIKNGSVPSANFVTQFIEQMIQMFDGCSKEVLSRKGMTTSEESLLR